MDELAEWLVGRFGIRFNTLTAEIEFFDPEREVYKALTDKDFNTIHYYAEKEFDTRDDKRVRRAMMHPDLVETYNPIHQYLEDLPPWDGHDHILDLANTIQVEDSQIEVKGNLQEIWVDFFTKWLVASLSPFYKNSVNQTCLVLVGKEGKGKTTWLNNLVPKGMEEYLAVGHLVPKITEQTTANLLTEKWLVNIDDQLDDIMKNELNSLKGVISAPSVTNRKPYARYMRRRMRVCSFMASINTTRFLTEGENRRYLTFMIKNVDYKVKVDMNKVWSQAKHLINEGFQFWFGPEETKLVNQINENYRRSSEEEEWLGLLYEPADKGDLGAEFLTASEILKNLRLFAGPQLKQYYLSKALSIKDFPRASHRKEGMPVYGYWVKKTAYHKKRDHGYQFE